MRSLVIGLLAAGLLLGDGAIASCGSHGCVPTVYVARPVCIGWGCGFLPGFSFYGYGVGFYGRGFGYGLFFGGGARAFRRGVRLRNRAFRAALNGNFARAGRLYARSNAAFSRAASRGVAGVVVRPLF